MHILWFKISWTGQVTNSSSQWSWCEMWNQRYLHLLEMQKKLYILQRIRSRLCVLYFLSILSRLVLTRQTDWAILQNFIFFMMKYTVIHTSVSNGTGQWNFSGQRDRSSIIVPGQRDNGTSQKSCQGTGRIGTAKIRDGTGRDNQKPGRDAGQNGTEQKRTF